MVPHALLASAKIVFCTLWVPAFCRHTFKPALTQDALLSISTFIQWGASHNMSTTRGTCCP